MAVVLTHGRLRVKVDPSRGGRLTELTLDGASLLATTLDDDVPAPYVAGSFPMAPWAGRLYKGEVNFDGQQHVFATPYEAHALHGLVADVAWALESVTDKQVTMSRALGPEWPFRGVLEQTVTVTDELVRQELVLQAGEVAMPAWLGFHPWFARDCGVPGTGQGQVRFRANSMLQRGLDGLPNGHRIDVSGQELPSCPLDDCFEDVSEVVVSWPGGPTLALRSQARWWVFFTERSDAFCVEPQTAPPDALRRGDAPILAPGGRQSVVLDYVMK